MIVSGGIQKSPSGIQRLANILNAPLDTTEEAEASLRGAAVFAAEKLGLPVPALQPSQTLQPQADIAALYREHREKQAELEERLG
jgi:sugar (pentulose or hexulose) kinase